MATPTLVLRGSEGIQFISNAPKKSYNPGGSKVTVVDNRKTCNCMLFSGDGSLFAWCNGETVTIQSVADNVVIATINKPKTSFLKFSPKSSVLCTWEMYAVTKDNPQGCQNLNLWDVKTGDLLRALVQKRNHNWHPQWTEDEEITARNVNNEVHFFEKNVFDSFANKLHLQKVSEYSLAPVTSPCHIAAYVPGSKGAPSFVRIFCYPNFDGPQAAIANRSFFKAERINMYWNHKGTAVLVLTSTEMSDSSYYGEQSLHFLATSGESCLVPLAKKGPIYSIQWVPKSKSGDFCIVYGYMPAKATIFNMKNEPVFDFATGPRNAVYFNCHGNICCLAGFGNLRGNVEFWDIKGKKKISNPTADDSTDIKWCPDGEHIVTATTAPRLRVSNGYKIWHYSGMLVDLHLTSQKHELWEVLWRPVPEGTFSEKSVDHHPISAPTSLQQQQPATNVEAYRPPGAKGKPSTFKVHEEEPVTSGAATEGMSKAALKNKKKREAKKAKQDQSGGESAPGDQSRQLPSAPSSGQMSANQSSDPEVAKRAKNLQKKLQAIEKLKQLQAEGKQLEKNQLEKISSEDKLLEELDKLGL